MQKKIIFLGFALVIFLSSAFLVIGTGFRASEIAVDFNQGMAQKLTREKVLEVGGIKEGTNVLFVNAKAVESKITAFEPLAEVTLERFFPNRISITINERTPAFVVQVEGFLEKAVLDLKFNFIEFHQNPYSVAGRNLVNVENVVFLPQGRTLEYFLGKNLLDFSTSSEYAVISSLLQCFANVGRSNGQFLYQFISIQVDVDAKKIMLIGDGMYRIEIFGYDRLLQQKIQYLEGNLDTYIAKHQGDPQLKFIVDAVDGATVRVTHVCSISLSGGNCE